MDSKLDAACNVKCKKLIFDMNFSDDLGPNMSFRVLLNFYSEDEFIGLYPSSKKEIYMDVIPNKQPNNTINMRIAQGRYEGFYSYNSKRVLNWVLYEEEPTGDKTKKFKNQSKHFRRLWSWDNLTLTETLTFVYISPNSRSYQSLRRGPIVEIDDNYCVRYVIAGKIFYSIYR